MSVPAPELVRELYGAFARRDVGAVLDRVHPDVVVRQTDLVPWGGQYRGHEGGVHEFLARGSAPSIPP